METVSDEESAALRCRLRLVMETSDGVEIDIEEILEGTSNRSELLRLRNRIIDRLNDRLVPRFQKQLWDWTESRIPREEGTFEEELVRRCDRNDDVISALEWLNPHTPSDEERGWQDRMVQIFMAREENELTR